MDMGRLPRSRRLRVVLSLVLTAAVAGTSAWVGMPQVVRWQRISWLEDDDPDQRRQALAYVRQHASTDAVVRRGAVNLLGRVEIPLALQIFGGPGRGGRARRSGRARGDLCADGCD